MIERVVLVKLKDDHAADGPRSEVAAYSKEALAAVPGVENVEVGVPADDDAVASWDLYLRLRFADLAAVAGYRDHPLHRAYVDDYLRPRMEVIKAWNFAVS